MSIRRVALAAAALATAFAAGLLAGRPAAPPPPTGTQWHQIREGRRGLLNPLLECEVEDPTPGREVRPFGRALGALVDALEQDPLVERLGVYYRDLDNGPWVGYHEKQGFIPASLAKVPIVLACLRQAEKDPAFLSRRIVHEGPDEAPDSPDWSPEFNLEHGKSYTVEELIRIVGAYSDNTAALLLRRAVEPGFLAEVTQDLGLGASRGRASQEAYSPRQYGAVFRVLYNSSYLERRLSEFALETFADSTFGLGLVAGVPPTVVVSHKFGVFWSEGGAAPLQLHDCGIVYHPVRPYLLCVMTSGSNFVKMAAAIAEVSRFVYGQVDQERVAGALQTP